MDDDAAKRVLALVSVYLAAVGRAMSVFERNGFPRPLDAVRAGMLPNRGIVGGMEYAFHGVGCVVRANDVTVDFDFGPGGRCDGFDAWRLWRFSESTGFGAGLSQATIARELRLAVRAGLVMEPRWLPSPTLLYLVEGD